MAKRLVEPNVTINFAPSERQMELWNTLQPARCDRCGGRVEMRQHGVDEHGSPNYEATCVECGNTDIPEQILGGGAAGGGKAVSLDSMICTPYGFRALRNIKVGDIISNPMTGGQQRVVHIHPMGKFPFYRVKFVDGTYTDCSEGHLWRAHQSRKKSKKAKAHPEHYAEYGDDRLWTAKQLYEWYQKKKSGMYDGCHLIIPLTKPVQFTTQEKYRTIDPYVLGALIGDGSFTKLKENINTIPFTTMDDEIVDRFEAAGYDMGFYTTKENNKAKQYIIHDPELTDALRRLGLSRKRSQTLFIPDAYLYGTIEERKQLMQGLMDADGYVDESGRMSYTSTSEQLAYDVAFLVSSLGGLATVTKGKSGYRKDNGEYVECSDSYDVYIRTKIDPELLGLTRKRERARYEFNGGVSELGKRIVDVKYIGEQESFCISVDDPSGLYIVDDFVVTHNSYIGCAWLISSCMRFPNILMAVGRLTLKSLKESTWRTLINLLHEWGLEDDINYHINNQAGTLTFWNGSTILMMELSPSLQDPDYQRFGSLEITGAFLDEVAEIQEKAVEVLASRIRYRVAETFVVGKILMTCNPTQLWPRRTFVMDDDANPVKLERGYRYIPFRVDDNPDESFRIVYINRLNKIRDKATRERLRFGNWLYPSDNQLAAYWNFDGEKHLLQGAFEKYYDPTTPIILSLDFNVSPYMSCLLIQIDYSKKKVYVIKEITGTAKEKLNNTPAFSKHLVKYFRSIGHIGGVILTGDPAGRARSTQTEDGVNNFTILSDEFAGNNVTASQKLFDRQPAQTTRLEFINELFNGFNEWAVIIDMRCRKFTEDLTYQMKNPDGTKQKKKVVLDSGERAEKYGHLSDCFDYAVTYFLKSDYYKYKNGSNTPVITTVDSSQVVYNEFDY